MSCLLRLVSNVKKSVRLRRHWRVSVPRNVGRKCPRLHVACRAGGARKPRRKVTMSSSTVRDWAGASL
eukprot:738747-Pyramimonas_sp.AAC.1